MSNQTQPHSRNVIENVIKNLDSIISATSVKSVLEHSKNIAKLLHFEDEYGLYNFFKLKNALNVKSLSKWNRVASILKTLDNKSQQKEYNCRTKIQGRKILVIGGGISGLRVSIELLLLGAKVFCVDKRDEFSRNNVIHLWPNVINDMYTFEAKRFYGQFCVGSIDHVSIRQLQLILLKIAIIYGLKFFPNTTFNEICPRIIEPREYKCNTQSCDCCCHKHGFGGGAYAHFSSDSYSNTNTVDLLNKQSFDVIIGCDGRRNTFSRYFPRNNRRGKLAIGLTANFVNRRTEDEAHCPEISGISRIYNQKWFRDLQDETHIELENLVYYRDETHYFVMTATKQSLLKRGVLKNDYGDSHQLLHLDNIDTNRLMKYSKDAAEWSSKLQRLEFASNCNNMPDVALFDFTSMYSATNASCAKKIYLKCCDKSSVITKEENSKYMLLLLCGDSLLEPFWPTGSGAGRGFLSALDAAWTVAQWFVNVSNESSSLDSMLNVISKREYVYRLLAQTSPENTTNKNFTLDPQTRYKNLNILDFKSLQDIKAQVKHLIIDGADVDVKTYLTSYESKRARRATVGIDPEDIIKAKNLMITKPDSKECNQMSISFRNNNNNYNSKNLKNSFFDSVPSKTVEPLSKSFHCDNDDKSPVEIINYKPRNFDDKRQQQHQQQQHVDVQPRNTEDKFSILTKKNHYARNHFFHNDRSGSFDKTSNFESTHDNNFAGYSPREKFNASHDRSVDQIFTNHGPSGSNKENYPNIPDFRQMFDFDIGDFEDENNKTSTNNHHPYPQPSKKTFNPLNDSRSFMSLHDFEKSLNRKPKKSSDILEKAQHLAQKFEDLKKPYVPNLSRVGKIEENDWNVKMWNSNDIFASKQNIDKKNLVYENSQDLLQSRIAQLNNNMQYNRKNDLPKSSNTNRISNDYVNMLSSEVCQKFQNNSQTALTAGGGGSVGGLTKEAAAKSLNENCVPTRMPVNIDSVDSYDSYQHGLSSSKRPSSTFLKPIGDCKRCNKTLLAIDKVTISGHHFHRNCLTCKMCFVMLRQDEVLNEDFTCKICTKSRSRRLQADAKSSFLMNNDDNESDINGSTFNLSKIEIKKNFLVNVEQIDLRERAEFEIIDKSNAGVIASTIVDENDVEDSGEYVDNVDESNDQNDDDDDGDGKEEDRISGDNNPEELPHNEEEAEQNDGGNGNDDGENEHDDDEDQDVSSELTESDVNYSSDNNYTDDENSDSEDFPSKNSIKEDYGSGFTSLICTNTVDSDALADDSARSSNAELIDLLTCDSDASSSINKNKNFAPKNSNDNDMMTKTEESSTPNTSATTTTNTNSSSFRCSLDADSHDDPLLMMNSPDDNNMVNLLINRENPPETAVTVAEAIEPVPVKTTGKDDENPPGVGRAKPQQPSIASNVKPLYSPYPRYPGQFTEKLFRSSSQPSLHDRLNLIDRKLKTKRSMVVGGSGGDQQTLSQDLPFADGGAGGGGGVVAEDGATMNKSSSTTRLIYNNSTRLTSAPFARIDDV